MSLKYKNIILTCLMAAVLFVISLSCWFRKAEDFSVSERRELNKFPVISWDAALSGNFAKEFESYAQDQFPLRDSFRALKAVTLLGVFRQSDNNQLYMENGYIAKMEYPVNEDMLNNASDHFAYLYETYMAGKDMNVYFSIVPDKNYYLAAEHKALEMDYSGLISYMQKKTDYMEYIDITGLLTIDDYYRTDSHWRQEKITDVAKLLAERMGSSVNGAYDTNALEKPFFGVYYGQLAMPAKADTLQYLTNEILEQCTVTSYSSGVPVPMEMYDMEKAYGKDPYEMFLSGSQPLITIENPVSNTGKELIIFRDSFGSSLAPLLAEGYSRITVVDTRYVSSSILGEWIDFKNQDVLFLYSTMLLNNSLSLK